VGITRFGQHTLKLVISISKAPRQLINGSNSEINVERDWLRFRYLLYRTDFMYGTSWMYPTAISLFGSPWLRCASCIRSRTSIFRRSAARFTAQSHSLLLPSERSSLYTILVVIFTFPLLDSVAGCIAIARSYKFSISASKTVSIAVPKLWAHGTFSPQSHLIDESSNVAPCLPSVASQTFPHLASMSFGNRTIGFG
jgi:hypothetical protein